MEFLEKPRRGLHSRFRSHGSDDDSTRVGSAGTPTRSRFFASEKLTPYLGLRSRVSQVWINRWTVLLFLILVRTLLAASGLHDGIDDARDKAMSACTDVESMGSTMASLPHYMSAGVNELTASGVEKAVNGLMSMLLLSVTGVEEIVVFFINMVTGTYLCLITLAVGTSLHAALALLEDATSFLNTTIGDIGKGIHDGIDDFQSALNTFTSGINDIGSFFGGDGNTIPTLNLDPELTELDNIHLPTSITDDLQKMNASIPTFDQVRNFTDNAIRLPFEELKKLINESLPNYQFNQSLFPVPQKEQLTFCSDNNSISDFFQGLIDIEILGKKIAIAVLVILAILVCIPMTYMEVRRYRKLRERAQLATDHGKDPVDVVYIASRPHTAETGLKLAGVASAPSRKVIIRWIIAYATSPPALFVLSLGLAGLASCLCQYILLKAIEKEVPELSQEIGDFASHVVTALDNASAEWANGSNTAILDINNKINDDVFGWVNITTHALNATLNTFVDETIGVLNDTFGGTILYDPITEVFNCLIGLKIAGIQKGLTWISDNAHVDFPLLPNNTFSLGAAASLTNTTADDSFLSNPSDQATSKVEAALTKLLTKFQNSIETEAIISTCVVLVWLLVFFMGTSRGFYLLCRRDRIRDSDMSFFSKPTEIDDYHGSEGYRSEKRLNISKPILSYHAPPVDTKAGSSEAPPYVPVPLVNVAGQNSTGATSYNGVQFTLDKRPMPTFKPNQGDSLGVPDERLGFAGARDVDRSTSSLGHQRTSSAAEIALASPGGANTRGIRI